jgi:hypothetical protein
MVNSGLFDRQQKPVWHTWLKFLSGMASAGGFIVTVLVFPAFHWTLWVNDELLAHHIHLEEIKAEQLHVTAGELAVRATLDDIRAQIQTRHLDLVQRLTRVETALEKK